MVDMYMSEYGDIKIAAPSIRSRLRTDGPFSAGPIGHRRRSPWFSKFEKRLNAAAEYFWVMGSALCAINEHGQLEIMEPQFPVPPPKSHIGRRIRFVESIDDDTDISEIISEVCGVYPMEPLTFADFRGAIR